MVSAAAPSSLTPRKPQQRRAKHNAAINSTFGSAGKLSSHSSKPKPPGFSGQPGGPFALLITLSGRGCCVPSICLQHFSLRYPPAKKWRQASRETGGMHLSERRSFWLFRCYGSDSRWLNLQQTLTRTGQRLIWIVVCLSICAAVAVETPFLLLLAGTSEWQRFAILCLGFGIIIASGAILFLGRLLRSTHGISSAPALLV